MKRLFAGAAALALLASAAQAQIAVAPGGAGVTGVPVGVAGYGAGAAPVVPGGYALSTAPAGNPYVSNLSRYAGPYGYGLSTAPYTGGYIPPYSLPYYDYGRMDPYSGYLQGVASVTAATGQYYQDIQKARLTRYAANNAALDYAKNRIRHEAWLESTAYLSTAAIRERDAAAGLDAARRGASDSEIASGKALNDLLRSIVAKSSLSRGPNLPLEEDTLRHINLTTKAAAGNVSMLKDGGKLAWPLGLQDPMFKESRERLSRKLEEAVETIKGGKTPDRSALTDLGNDLKALEAKVTASTDDLPISQYLEAKRYLAQLRSALRSLSDPNTKNFLNNTWNAKGRTVAELVDHMRREGLTFNAAGPGDDASYLALYYSMRAFEAGLAAQR